MTNFSIETYKANDEALLSVEEAFFVDFFDHDGTTRMTIEEVRANPSAVPFFMGMPDIFTKDGKEIEMDEEEKEEFINLLINEEQTI